MKKLLGGLALGLLVTFGAQANETEEAETSLIEDLFEFSVCERFPDCLVEITEDSVDKKDENIEKTKSSRDDNPET